MEQMKAASLAAVDATPEAISICRPGTDAPAYADGGRGADDAGRALADHAGQFVPIRRKLGKPPLF